MTKISSGADPLGDARDALFAAECSATRLADAVRDMEQFYAAKYPELWEKFREAPPVSYFQVPTVYDNIRGRTLDPNWKDHAPAPERGPRRAAIDATLALRADVDRAVEAVAAVATYMDSEAESVDQRWTTRTIGHLRRLRGAILRGFGPDAYPSALPVIRAGVPDALSEHAAHVAERREELKSAILAGTKPRTPTASMSPNVLERLERMAAAVDPHAIDSAAERAAEKTARMFGGDDAPKARLPDLKAHDRQAWQLATLHGMTQAKVAAALNKEYGTTYTQGQVSRMIARAKAHADTSGLTEKVAGAKDRPRTVDPAQLELGARVDKRKPRPSDMARANDDDA